jgi:hypothetical protein
MTEKSALGILSIAIMAVAYAIYLWQTIRHDEVQPHPFSWLLWGFVTGVVYLVQRTEGGGAGSWVTGFTAIICLLIGGVSFLKHRWKFSRFDWLSLALGVFVFGFYLFTKEPTQSAVLATATDLVGYGSTIKKGWAYPRADSATSFLLNSLKFVPSLFALDSYSVATWLYPLTLVFVNGAVAVMLIARRRHARG